MIFSTKKKLSNGLSPKILKKRIKTIDPVMKSIKLQMNKAVCKFNFLNNAVLCTFDFKKKNADFIYKRYQCNYYKEA